MASPGPLGLASIILVGISANFPNPGVYVEVDFAVGSAGIGPTAKAALIMGNKTTAGSATPDTVVYGPDTQTPCQTESDVINLFGTGSQIHRAWLRWNKVNKQTSVYFIAVTESAGVAAVGQVQVTGASATSGGNIRFWYGDEFVDTPVQSGDLQAAIATNIAFWINTQTRWGITASAASGLVTITAKNKGPEPNWAKIQVLNGPGFTAGGITVSVSGTTWAAATVYPVGSQVTPTTANGFYYRATAISGTGTSGGSQPVFPTTIGTTVVDNSGPNQITWTCWGTLSGAGIATLGGGATADSNVAALVTIAPTVYRRIVVCDSDSTNVGRVITQATSQALPGTGIRQQVFFGSVDTLANAITVATAQNAPRGELQWGVATDVTPLEVAAHNAAVYSLLEDSGNSANRPVVRLNFSLFPVNATDQASWFLVGTRNGPASGPTVGNITSALNNGLTPLSLLPNGKVQLVKRITTRSLNGSVNDYRIRDAHKVSICDAWADAASATTKQNFGGKDLLNPPAQGQPFSATATNTVLWGNALKDVTSRFGASGLLQNTDATNASAIIQRETSPSTRMSAQFQLVTADIFDQGNILVQQVG